MKIAVYLVSLLMAIQSVAQLNDLTNRFINNTLYQSNKSSAMSLAKIFDIYKSDFGDFVTFVDKFSKVQSFPKYQNNI